MPDSGVSFDVLRNRSFIRLDQVSLGYNMPQDYLERINVKNLKLFINIQNLFYMAPDWELFDPQTGGLYPRIFTLGINFNL
jgi:hypothetical protein